MIVFSFLIPILFISLFIFASIKKVKIYDSFTKGAKGGLDTVLAVLPFLITVFVMTELFYVSGLSSWLIDILFPFFNLLGIPKEICPLIILKPFSGSGSLAILSDIFNSFGVDSYVSRCACAVFGSSETIFYLSAVYYSKSKEKRLTKAITISLLSTFISTIFACFICKFI